MKHYLPGDWREGIDPEDELWVCPECDAHLHADAVGEEGCPRCGANPPDDLDEASDRTQGGM